MLVGCTAAIGCNEAYDEESIDTEESVDESIQAVSGDCRVFYSYGPSKYRVGGRVVVEYGATASFNRSCHDRCLDWGASKGFATYQIDSGPYRENNGQYYWSCYLKGFEDTLWGG